MRTATQHGNKNSNNYVLSRSTRRQSTVNATHEPMLDNVGTRLIFGMYSENKRWNKQEEDNLNKQEIKMDIIRKKD